MNFATNWSQRMRIAENGNIGIGTTTPTEKLDVDGNVRATAFLYSSDRRLKADITPYTDGKNVITHLEAKRYNWKDSWKPDVWVIAQEVQKVFPEAVSEWSDGMLAVDYVKLIVPLLQVTQEQEKIIKEQGRQIAHQEERLSRMEEVLNLQH